jgi:hypothetical protein
LLWLFVIVSGISVGAGLYEMRINVPRWFPAHGSTVGVDAIQSDDSGRRFWGMVTTAHAAGAVAIGVIPTVTTSRT